MARMSARIIVILSLPGGSLVLGACGSSGNEPLDASGSLWNDGSGQSRSPGLDSSSDDSSDDATSTRTSVSDGGSDVGFDGRTAADAATPSADASIGDADVQRFKGVAGSSSCSELATLGVSWWYNWTTSASGCTATPFVPMVWGHSGNEQSAAGIASEVRDAVGAGYPYILGFNEPDNTSQSNISVAAAISLWPAFKNSSLRLGSPATQGNGTGLTWIQTFMTQVNADTTGNLQVDFIATHWYGWNAGSCDAKAANLESWIKSIEDIPGNRPIWLTEWGCLNASNPDPATVEAFFSGALTMLAKHPRVERYAWYQFETNNELVDTDGGALTALGTTFAAAPAFR